MGMPAQQEITTIEELLALPEDGMRHELLDGKHVVTPSPAVDHQRLVRRLLVVLDAQLGSVSGLEVFTGPADIHLSIHTLVQPDVLIVSRDDEQPARRWRDLGTPLVAIEVTSPSTAARDRGKKRRLYLEAGVEEYWIVDIDAKLIERWHAGDDRPEIVDDVLRWELRVGVSGSVEVRKLFERL